MLKPAHETGVTPEPYQLELVQRALGQRELIAAMEMGTGKTLAALMAICRYREAKDGARTLVICPPSLVQGVWKKEIERMTTLGSVVQYLADKRGVAQPPGSICVSTYQGLARHYRAGWKLVDRAEQYTDAQGRVRFKKAWVRRDGHPFLETPWDLVIMDESHTIRNADLNVSLCRACEVATASASHVLMLTGTPIQNGPLDLLGQMVGAGHAGPLSRVETYGRHGTISSELIRHVSNITFKVTMSDATFTLPEKRSHTVHVDHGLEGADLELYNRTLQKAKDLYISCDENGKPSGEDMQLLRQCMQSMRRLAMDPAVQHFHGALDAKGAPAFTDQTVERAMMRLSPKVARVCELYMELARTHKKVVISSDSVNLLTLVQQALHRKHDVLGLMYNGSLSAARKDRVVTSFLTDPEERCLLLSLIAGGEGLNLVPGPTAMIVCSFWYNPARHRQLEARIHRRGQTEETHIYNVVARHTIDEAILKVHDDKTACSNILLELAALSGASDAGVTSWKRFGKIVNECPRLLPDGKCEVSSSTCPSKLLPVSVHSGAGDAGVAPASLKRKAQVVAKHAFTSYAPRKLGPGATPGRARGLTAAQSAAIAAMQRYYETTLL